MSNDHQGHIPEDQLAPQDYPPRSPRLKLTLVQILVCVATVCVLIGLLLPAVQSPGRGDGALRSVQDESQRRLELIEQAEAAEMAAEQEVAAR